jgi:outer membrane lipoprotein SlyB
MTTKTATQCVVAVYDSGVRAQLAVEKLLGGGVGRDSISLFARSLRGAEADVKRAVQLGDEAEKNATLGAGIGGIIGALGGSALTMAAGATVLVVAGPLVALTGAIVGGLVGSIAGWGIHRDRASEYQKLVEEGKVLVIVHSEDPTLVAKGEKLLQLTHPESLNLHAKVDDADDPRVDDT